MYNFLQSYEQNERDSLTFIYENVLTDPSLPILLYYFAGKWVQSEKPEKNAI